MAELHRGMLREIDGVRVVFMHTSDGRISLYRGSRRTSSNVNPS
jgi:hypothetical protein